MKSNLFSATDQPGGSAECHAPRGLKTVKTRRRKKTAKMQFAMLTQVNALKRRRAMILHERFAKAGSQQGRRRDTG
jgi:hypothetical protein